MLQYILASPNVFIAAMFQNNDRLKQKFENSKTLMKLLTSKCHVPKQLSETIDLVNDKEEIQEDTNEDGVEGKSVMTCIL